jgi:tRNA pseudouridine38-40 synthase
MRYFIHIGYDGGNFKGWQRQKTTSITIQEIIEKVLLQFFKKNIKTVGCGRTDAGVHASQYIFHIDLNEPLDFDFKFRLNKNLPHGIVVFDVIKVNEDQHARYHATARTYDYFIHLKKDPILHLYSSYYGHLKLDFELMKKATELISKTKDFRALCKEPNAYNNTICRISHCELIINEKQNRLRFTITGNRFLQGMIRYCIFFLLEVGCGKMNLKEFEQFLNQETSLHQKKPAYPNGLFLSKIEYPFLKLNNAHQLIMMLKTNLDCTSHLPM